MIRMITFCILLLPGLAFAGDLPNSVGHWKEQADHFFGMEATDEPRFKADLKAHLAKIYSGKQLQALYRWVDEGSVESDHFSSYFTLRREVSLESLTRTGERRYEADAVQRSCYNLEYSPPPIETVVDDYKIVNMTQEEIDAWYELAWRDLEAEFCLSVDRRIVLDLDQADGLIIKETWTVLASTISLTPALPPPETP